MTLEAEQEHIVTTVRFHCVGKVSPVHCWHDVEARELVLIAADDAAVFTIGRVVLIVDLKLLMTFLDQAIRLEI